MESEKKKLNIGHNIWLVVIVIFLGILLGSYLLGNQNKVSMILNYMEEKYHTKFEYVGETNGIFGDRSSFTAELTHPDYPGDIILASYSKKDGQKNFGDNFPAVYYHNDAYQKIEQCLDQVFTDYKLYFEIPDLLLPNSDASNFTLNDYLSTGYIYIPVRIFVFEALNDQKFQSMMDVFTREGISFQGAIVEPSNYNQARSITTMQDFNDFIVGEDRVTTWFNFQLEDGTITKDVLISYGVNKKEFNRK